MIYERIKSVTISITIKHASLIICYKYCRCLCEKYGVIVVLVYMLLPLLLKCIVSSVTSSSATKTRHRDYDILVHVFPSHCITNPHSHFNYFCDF